MDEAARDGRSRDGRLRTAADLFGVFVPPGDLGGPYAPDPETLRLPLEGPRSAIHAFCTNCRTHYEITRAGLDAICTSTGLASPSGSLAGLYLETGTCSMCRCGKTNVAIHPIP